MRVLYMRDPPYSSQHTTLLYWYYNMTATQCHDTSQLDLRLSLWVTGSRGQGSAILFRSCGDTGQKVSITVYSPVVKV